MAMSEAVLYQQQERVVTLTLNRPETRNALDPAVFEGLEKACRRVNEDESVSCVILTGAGQSFCAGGNVKGMRERTSATADSPAQKRRQYLHGIQRIPLALYNIEVPIIAAVNGYAVGAGCDIAMMCDLRVVADNAQFAENFIRLGVISGDGGSWFLPRVVGFSRACEMSYTGEFVKADKAEKWGMANSVVPAGRLMEEAMVLASKIASQAPVSLRLCKKLLRDGQQLALSAHLEMAAGMQAAAQHTEDHREALAAMFQKRKPVFLGK
jgi:enoyl-CoA hydratase/carnithine racemase